MRCTKCGSYNLRCIDSRESTTHPGRRHRRHKCQDCGHRFTTIEIALEEYENLCGLRKCEHRAVVAKFRTKVIGILTAMKEGATTATCAVCDVLLAQILQIEV